MSYSFKHEIGQRLKEVRESMGLTQKQFCVFFGPIVRTVSMVSEYENGVSSPPQGLFVLLGRKRVNLNWLFTGEGTMHEAVCEEDAQANSLEREYVEKFLQILRTKQDKTVKAIIQNVDAFLDNPDKEGHSAKAQKKHKAANDE